MAGKEAIVFLVDCNRSMAAHMELAREAVRVLMVQKMLQSKQHELGVVLFGLPEEETSNKLNDKDEGDYLGVKELCMLDRGSVEVLRSVGGIDVPDAGNAAGKGDVLDAMVVGLHMIRSRTLKKKYLRHVYLLTDASTPVEEASQLPDIVGMYTDASMECKLHFVGFGGRGEGLASPAIKEETHAEGGSRGGAAEQQQEEEEKKQTMGVVKEQNEMMLASVAAATQGTTVPAATIVGVMGESTIKTTNPVMSKVDLLVGTKLALHCRFFKKTDTGLKESLKKESIASYDAAAGGASEGKVRVDKTYRDPEMPEVEVDYENQVKGYRYGQDYIPVNAVDEGSLKLPQDELPSVKVLGFIASSTIPRHLYMDDTFVLVPEPGSVQSGGAISCLTRAMRNLDQIAVVRFLKRKGSEPWLGVLLPDPTGVSSKERLLFQKIPFSEDIRDYTFPSFSKPPSSRKPSKEQREVSASLVSAMMIREFNGSLGGVRSGLVLDPVRQGVNGAKVARAMDPECELPEVHSSVKAALSPDQQLVENAGTVFEEYRRAFQFEKRDRAKAGKKRVTYFSDLTLAEPESSPGPTGGEEGERASKKSRADSGSKESSGGDSKAMGPAATRKVGSIDPVSDFEAMMAAAIDGEEGGAELAELAVEQMQGVIHTLIRKGTTASLRVKAVTCVKALRGACVRHFMGKRYNVFLHELKESYQSGDSSDVWEMVVKEEGAWPATSDDDASLTMTPQEAAEFMKSEGVKEEEEEAQEDEGDDDDLDDMS